MVEVGVAEYFSIGEALGIIGTMFVVLYFSRKQMQSLSTDIQANVLNDLGDKYLKMVERVMEDPSMQRVFDSETKFSREEAYSFYALWICSHAYAMRKRNILDDNEWAGWLQWMKHIFRRGTIKETWKQIESDKWFNPNFEKFLNEEIAPQLGSGPTDY
jgi:hypothetical protein